MIGFINAYKPQNVTSNFVVKQIKKKFHIKKIGHMGTLDPMACGILPIAIGKATRLFNYSQNKKKRYTAIFDFGYTTDTLDITGNITDRCNNIPTNVDIQNAITSMIGTYSQMPPKFSAKNINGRRAYDLAREGIDFELKPKDITIFDLKLIDKVDINRYKFDIVCSSGTYIRAIGRDLANKLDTLACMSFLERTETGEFNKNNSIMLDDILNNENIENILLNPIQVFKNFDIINIDKDIYSKLKNGIKISNFNVKNTSFILYNSNIIGISNSGNFLKLDTFLEE